MNARLAALVLGCLACVVPATAAVDSEQLYDISYVRGLGLAEAFRCRSKVAEALGPRVERLLRVVPGAEGYDLVYLRRGDAHGARVTASSHARILEPRGFRDLAPVPSQDWKALTEDGARVIEAAEAEAGAAEKRRLEELVERHVMELRRQGRLAHDERTAWSVYDFTTGEKLVEINADVKLQAASLIKPFVVLAYMHQVEEGRLVYDEHCRAQLERMIQHSNNAATNWAMRKLGGPAAVQRLLQEHYGDLLQTVEITEYIPRGGRTYKNKASARDYSSFLFALWKGQLPGSAEIKRLMGLRKRDRLYTGAGLPENTEVYSKTGSTRQLCGDIGVLLAKGPDGREYAYTLIGIIEKAQPARNYLRWLRSRGNIIREVSNLVYRAIGAMHGL